VIDDQPLVSVCIPTFNAEPWIRSTVESVLAQTHERLELVISDGGSTDATRAILGEYADPRIRTAFSTVRLQAIENWNRSVVLATGDYLKFLHQDDTLVPTCLEEMLALALEDPDIGLVFGGREIVLDEDADAEDIAWVERYGKLHSRFRVLERVNDGYSLFRQMLDADLEENWIGEPSSVMVTRSGLVKAGLFNPRMRQVMDLDLWCRVMLGSRVGFVDSRLSTYLHHRSSMTSRNARLALDWLDRVWLFEGLLTEELAEPERKKVQHLRSGALRTAIKAQVARIARRRFSGELVDYSVYRARAAAGAARPLYPRIPDAPPDPWDGRGTSPTRSRARRASAGSDLNLR
jgi:glycosyltransferase involved in cell wall biosynthesis